MNELNQEDSSNREVIKKMIHDCRYWISKDPKGVMVGPNKRGIKRLWLERESVAP